MFKKIAITFVGLAIIGAFLPETEKAQATPVKEVAVVELTEAEKQEEHNKWYMGQRYLECYGAMTVAHKKNGLQERNRALAIKTRESICTAAQTDAGITAWNKVYTEVK